MLYLTAISDCVYFTKILQLSPLPSACFTFTTLSPWPRRYESIFTVRCPSAERASYTTFPAASVTTTCRILPLFDSTLIGSPRDASLGLTFNLIGVGATDTAEGSEGFLVILYPADR